VKWYRVFTWDLMILLSCILVAMAITSIVFAEEPTISRPYISASEEEAKYIVPIHEEEPVAELVEEPEEPAIPAFYRDDIPMDLETQEILYNACEEFEIDYNLALAVVWQETNFQNLIGDGGNSEGYMQIQRRWIWDIMEEIGASDLMNPVDNFRTGCRLLSEFINTYGVEGGLTRYNTGSPGDSYYADCVMAKWRSL